MSESWIIEEDAGGGAVSIVGEIDFTVAPSVKLRIHELIARTNGDLTFKLDKLSYLDSSGLAVFIDAKKTLEGKSRKLVLKEVSPQVDKIFRLTHLSEFFGL